MGSTHLYCSNKVYLLCHPNIYFFLVLVSHLKQLTEISHRYIANFTWLSEVHSSDPCIYFTSSVFSIDECWSPLGVQSLPTSSFRASSQQPSHMASAGRLHFRDPHSDLQGWSPEPEEYRELPPSSPHGHTHNSQAPYLQIDLLRPYNITGACHKG